MSEFDLENAILALPLGVPDGELLRSWHDGVFRFYLSDGPAPPSLWPRLREQHPRSGLWPVYLQGAPELPAYLLLNGWSGRSVGRDGTGADAEAVLAREWEARSGAPWPGLAPPVPLVVPPGRAADNLAKRLVNSPDTLLGLVMTGRAADIPALIGWRDDGPVTPAEVSAVLRSWEDRFGARLVRLGFESLLLSVAGPPATRSEALAVAAEHLAFGAGRPRTESPPVEELAEGLVGATEWFFAWDPYEFG